jgi:putative membrane protein
MSLPTLSIWMVAAIFVFITILAYFMFSLEIENLKKLMYGNGSGSSLRNKIANKIAIYGMSFLGIGVIINFIIKSFSIKFSTSLEGLGLLITWIILNIAVIAMLIYIEFPSYLQAFYKWKYPEEYREWERKTVEEWYGKKYLKKHKELLK